MVSRLTRTPYSVFFSFIVCVLVQSQSSTPDNQCEHDASEPVEPSRQLLQSQRKKDQSLLSRLLVNYTREDQDKVVIYWSHGFFVNPTAEKREDYTADCGFPCVRAAYPDDNAWDMADVLLSFPIESTVPRNKRNGVSVAFTQESSEKYGARNAPAYDASMSLNWRSTVPWTLLDPVNLQRARPMDDTPSWEERKPAAVFIAKNCLSEARNKFVSDLVQHGVTVESISDCKPDGTSGKWPDDVPNELVEDKPKVLEKYRVYLALENLAEEGYVTEKLTHGLIGGAVTVYWGAPDIDNYLPNSAFIRAPQNYMDDIEGLAKKIKDAIEKKDVWESYRSWTTQSIGEWNDGKIAEAFSYSDGKPYPSPFCRLCSFAVAKRLGYDWDKKTQSIIGFTVPPTGDDFWKTWRPLNKTVQ